MGRLYYMRPTRGRCRFHRRVVERTRRRARNRKRDLELRAGRNGYQVSDVVVLRQRTDDGYWVSVPGLSAVMHGDPAHPDMEPGSFKYSKLMRLMVAAKRVTATQCVRVQVVRVRSDEDTPHVLLEFQNDGLGRVDSVNKKSWMRSWNRLVVELSY